MTIESPARLLRLIIALLALESAAVAWTATPAIAQEQQDSQSDEAPMPGWLRRMARIREPGHNERNHVSVKSAFIDVVDKAGQATVMVYGDGVALALGAIVDENGYVLTKYSELQGDLLCQLHDGRRLEAGIVGVDQQHDLAMLKVEAVDLPIVEWADSPPRVGGWVVTVGFDRLPAAIGVVSVEPREVAAPSGMLGVSVDLNEPAKIKEIVAGSGAEEAGLKIGDEVLHIDGKRIETGQDVIDTLGSYHVGDRVRLSIRRDDEILTIHATLRSRRDTLGSRHPLDSQEDLAGPLSNRRSGFPLVLQHDTVLRPRDCGGPLVDLDGKVVGINIARAGRVASFATPAAAIEPLLAGLMSGQSAPGLSEEEQQLQLAETIRNLRESVSTWTEELKDLQGSLAAAQKAYDQAKLATAADQSAQAIIALKKAEQHKAAIEKDALRAQSELDKAVAELKKYDTQKVSVGS